MNEKELYRKKFQAQLDEWKADIAKFKAKASGAKADVQINLNNHVKDLDSQIKQASETLEKLSSANDDVWDSVKKGADSAWDSLKNGFHEASLKLKK